MDRHRLDVITWMLSLAGVGLSLRPYVVFQLAFYCLWFYILYECLGPRSFISNINYLALFCA